MKTVAGTLGNSNWVVETVAGWKMAWPTSLGDGATATFYMRDAVESYGSPTIPASGDYYIGWCYSTSQQMGTNGGAYYVDDTSGGKIYYYSGEGDMSNAHQRIPRQGDSWDDTMSGEKIHFNSANELVIPNNPIIPFIEGDGIGQDIWAAAVRVLDAAVKKAYGDKKKISWKKVLAGEEAFNEVNEWLPEETLEAIREHLVAIKGPLTTPVGGGFRSLNVTLRQRLDLFACVRPVRWFEGVPSPVKEPEKVDMAIFRENTEDIYAGIELSLIHI